MSLAVTQLQDIELRHTITNNYNVKLEYNSVGDFSFYSYHSDTMETHLWKTFFLVFEEFELTLQIGNREKKCFQVKQT